MPYRLIDVLLDMPKKKESMALRCHSLILGDPGAVSWVDKMFVVKAYIKIDLTVNFHDKHFIDPTNRPWVSEDAIVDLNGLF